MQQETVSDSNALATRAAEIVSLERAFWEALRDEDVEAALALAHDPCVVIGPEGHGTLGRHALEELLRSSPDELEHFEFQGEPSVHFVRPDVAVISYALYEELRVAGAPVRLEVVETSTWVRRDGRWQVAVHAEAVRGDPYGRDRVARPS